MFNIPWLTVLIQGAVSHCNRNVDYDIDFVIRYWTEKKLIFKARILIIHVSWGEIFHGSKPQPGKKVFPIAPGKVVETN